MIQHWTGLRLQGRLGCISHAALQSTALHNDIHTFSIKACLQVLPTKANLATWFPTKHEPFCLLHHNRQRQSIAHILNGCPAYKGLYIARHDRIVALAIKELHDNINFTTIHTNKSVKSYWFSIPHAQRNTMKTAITVRTFQIPDLVIIDEHNKAITIIEIGCSYDGYTDICYASKLLKYQPFNNVLNNYGQTTMCVCIHRSVSGLTWI